MAPDLCNRSEMLTGHDGTSFNDHASAFSRCNRDIQGDPSRTPKPTSSGALKPLIKTPSNRRPRNHYRLQAKAV